MDAIKSTASIIPFAGFFFNKTSDFVQENKYNFDLSFINYEFSAVKTNLKAHEMYDGE